MNPSVTMVEIQSHDVHIKILSNASYTEGQIHVKPFIKIKDSLKDVQ